MAHNRNGDKMKKLLRTMVVAPMYLFIYVIAFSWAFTNPFWGFLALAGLDLLGGGYIFFGSCLVNRFFTFSDAGFILFDLLFVAETKLYWGSDKVEAAAQ